MAVEHAKIGDLACASRIDLYCIIIGNSDILCTIGRDISVERRCRQIKGVHCIGIFLIEPFTPGLRYTDKSFRGLAGRYTGEREHKYEKEKFKKK